MRPTPNELIDGIRRVLKDVIGPEIGSDLAAARLRQILAQLRSTDWDEAPLKLRRDVEDMQALLAECRDWLNGTPDRRSRFAAAWTEIEDLLESGLPPRPSFADINTRDLRCRQALAGFIDALRTSEDTGVPPIRERLWRHFVNNSG